MARAKAVPWQPPVIAGSKGREVTQLTELLGRVRSGDAQARDALFTAAYAELHRLARARLVTERTVQRDWDKARLILAEALR